ncbi:MAG: metalloregulator ArsR/SmtB family transcription factor [Baekduia sp.]
MVADRAIAERALQALADPTRRDIVRRAARGEHSVSALARNYPISVTATQKHVAVLERAGLVRKERRGREQIVISRPEQIRTARMLLEELEELWRGRIDRMNEILEGGD